jgi:hypothetical protein
MSNNNNQNWFQSNQFILEVAASIFSFLTLKERFKCRSVCKIFKSIIHSHYTWSQEMYTLIGIREFKHVECEIVDDVIQELTDFHVILKKQNNYYLMKFKNSLGSMSGWTSATWGFAEACIPIDSKHIGTLHYTPNTSPMRLIIQYREDRNCFLICIDESNFLKTIVYASGDGGECGMDFSLFSPTNRLKTFRPLFILHPKLFNPNNNNSQFRKFCDILRLFTASNYTQKVELIGMEFESLAKSTQVKNAKYIFYGASASGKSFIAHHMFLNEEEVWETDSSNTFPSLSSLENVKIIVLGNKYPQIHTLEKWQELFQHDNNTRLSLVRFSYL